MENKEIKFSHPIKKDDGKEYTLAELFEIQEKEKFGQFLLSANNFWHGGIHFSSELHDKNKPIHAIADGKVIAYRVNKANKISKYQDEDSDLELKYSTGFCLIKHEYGVLERKGPEQIAKKEKADAIHKDITDKVEHKNISLDKDNIGTYNAAEYEQFLKDGTEVTRKGSVKDLKLNVLEIDQTPRQSPSGKGDKYYFGKAKVIENLGEFSKDDEVYVALFKENGEVFNDLFQLPKNTVSIPNLNGDPTNDEVSQLLISINKNSVVTGASSAPQSIGNVVVTPKEEPLLNKITFYSLYVHLLAYDDFGNKERPKYWETKEEKPQTIDVSGQNVILGQSQIASPNKPSTMTVPKNSGIQPKPEPKAFDTVVSVDIDIKAGDIVGYMGVYDALALVEREDKSDPNKQGLVVGINHVAKKEEQESKPQTQTGSSTQSGDDFELDDTAIASEYIVQSGDNLTKISLRKANEANALHNINIVPGTMQDEIMRYSGNEAVQRAPHNLKIGQVIKIPPFRRKLENFTEDSNEKDKDDSNKESKHQVHVELFILTEDDVKKLLDNPANLKQDRQYIKVKQSASLYTKDGNELKKADYLRQALVAELAKNTPDKIGELEYYSIKVDQKPYAGKSYYVDKKDVDGDIFCQHDWRKLGFEIAEGDSNSHGYLTDKQTLKIFDEIYEKIPREDNCLKLDYISQDSFRQFVFGKEEYDYYRRRVVAKHPTEWQGTQNNKFVDMLKLLTNAEYDPNKLGQLMRVVDRFTNNEINAKRANAIFEHEKERIEKLAFWDEVSELCTKMPYHFHPLAFVGNGYIQKKYIHVTFEQLREMMPSASEEKIREYIEPINITMEVFDIKSNLRKAHFLAQIAHETAELVYTEEIASGAAYENRDDLGNNQKGDGKRFKGRGLLQLTGRSNYTRCQAYLRTVTGYENLGITSTIDITSHTSENDRKQAEQVANSPLLGTLVSGYYWKEIRPKLNVTADKDDIYWVSVYVNGRQVQEKPYYTDKKSEPNGMKHRVQMITRAKKIFNIK